MNQSVKARIAALQKLAAVMQNGVGIIMLLDDGTWSTCRSAKEPPKTFPTEADARAYLGKRETIIILDV